MLDFTPFEIFTFDCYGTLINWKRESFAACVICSLRMASTLTMQRY